MERKYLYGIFGNNSYVFFLNLPRYTFNPAYILFEKVPV